MSHIDIYSLVKDRHNVQTYRALTWTGTLQDYLKIVAQKPRVTRTAFQRLFDMIVSYGTDEYIDSKKRIVQYRFFDDPVDNGKDAIYGLDVPLMKLVDIFKSAAMRYGTERRVILLHGPVGSCKSTIARLLKKGLEAYSRTEEGQLYTFGWRLGEASDTMDWCPMHEEPLRLVPEDLREEVVNALNAELPREQKIYIEGDLCPFCRRNFHDLMLKYDGNWEQVMSHIVVKRLVLSEKDRVGIGTFQPKDEKNQDSTELTGDINYRKIAEYGSDSDPRAFNFDGEFNIANRGLVEFVEVLKLDVAFLYDLLGASQEHKVKPKKFAQTDIDEVIIGHSVGSGTPIAYRHFGIPHWTTIDRLEERFRHAADGLEVLAYDFARMKPRWTGVRRIFRHRFEGEMLTSSQSWGAVETTPNHSIYDRDGNTFFPEERHELLAVRELIQRFAPSGAALDTIDLLEDVPGFAREGAAASVGGRATTHPTEPGTGHFDLEGQASGIKTSYDPVTEQSALLDLTTLLVWYATRGQVDAQRGGTVVTHADRSELERVAAACRRITSAEAPIEAGAETVSAWCLRLGSKPLEEVARHHCGDPSHDRRLPDLLFRLPAIYLEHALRELVAAHRGCTEPEDVCATAGDERSPGAFELATLSPLLAAQVGTLATLLGKDYDVSRQDRRDMRPIYRIRFLTGEGGRGRHTSSEARLHRRPARGEWVYDIECHGLHNFVCGVGNVVCHNTNEPEYRKLEKNEYMEALRDRTVKIDIPYVTKLDQEIRIYEKDYNSEKIQGKHIAPHTIEVAAMWAILTRLEEPRKAELTLMQKLKLYNGKTLPGFTEDNVRELRKEARREGMDGISPRYIQDKISNSLVRSEEPYINPFMVLNELESGLRHHSLITNEEERKRYLELLSVVKEEYENIVKNEVQRAIAADEEAISRLFGNYIDSVKAYTQKEKVRNRYTGRDEEPDERMMRSIEEKIDIPESRKDDFRREIMNYIGALAVDGKQFDWRSNARLQKALEMKLFEDQKDTIKLTSLVSSVVDKDTQEKIDIVKSRLIKYYGYSEESASDVLHYVASIFARGDAS